MAAGSPRLSMNGVDFSTPAESNLTPTASGQFLTAVYGQFCFAEDTGRIFMCLGSGVWAPFTPNLIAAPGGAGSEAVLEKLLTGLTDNTATNLAVVTIPNVLAAGVLEVLLSAGMGDGDSAEASIYTVAFSRIAGANAKITISTKSIIALVTGASGNAVATLSNTAVGGGLTAVNTFQLQAKVARSAGTATNHTLMARMRLLNNVAGGLTIA